MLTQVIEPKTFANHTETLPQAVPKANCTPQEFIQHVYELGWCLNRASANGKRPIDKGFTKNLGYQRAGLNDLLLHINRGRQPIFTPASGGYLLADIDEGDPRGLLLWLVEHDIGHFITHSRSKNGLHVYIEADESITDWLTQRNAKVDRKTKVKEIVAFGCVIDYKCNGGYGVMWHLDEWTDPDHYRKGRELTRAEFEAHFIPKTAVKELKKKARRRKKFASGEASYVPNADLAGKIAAALGATGSGWVNGLHCPGPAHSGDPNTVASLEVSTGVMRCHGRCDCSWSPYQVAEMLGISVQYKSGREVSSEKLAKRIRKKVLKINSVYRAQKQQLTDAYWENKRKQAWKPAKIDANIYSAALLAGSKNEAFLRYLIQIHQREGTLGEEFELKELMAVAKQSGISKSTVRRLCFPKQPDGSQGYSFVIEEGENGKYRLAYTMIDLGMEYRAAEAIADTTTKRLKIVTMEDHLLLSLQNDQDFSKLYEQERRDNPTYQYAESYAKDWFKEIQAIGDDMPAKFDITNADTWMGDYLRWRFPHGHRDWNLCKTRHSGIKSLTHQLKKHGLIHQPRPFHYEGDPIDDEAVRNLAAELYQDDIAQVSQTVITNTTYKKIDGVEKEVQCSLVYLTSIVWHYEDERMIVEDWEPSERTLEIQAERMQKQAENREVSARIQDRYDDRIIRKPDRDEFFQLTNRTETQIHQAAELLEHFTDGYFERKHNLLWEKGRDEPLTYEVIWNAVHFLAYRPDSLIRKNETFDARYNLELRIKAEIQAEGRAELKEEVLKAEYDEWESQSDDIPF